MKKALKTFLIAALSIILLLAAAGFIYFRSFYFPKVSGEIKVAGLKDKIEIYRDGYGIPHIIAGSEEDAFFGLGFAMAQDRPFQLEIFRRAANGLLSEVLPGEEMRRMDRFSRFVQFGELGRRLYKNMDEESRSYVRAFVAGVNEGYASLKGPLPRPLTMAAFGGGPGEWKPEDPLALGLLVAWMKAANYDVEYFYTRLIKKVGRDRAMELLPYYPPPMDDYVALPPDSPILAAGAELGRLLGVGAGCSAWAVSGRKTVSGESALVYNAHTGGGRVPAEHYLVHMKGGALDMAGAAIAGVPGFYSGSNRHIAWGLTQNESDSTDLYREKINPDNPNQYLNKGEWTDFAVRTEKICRKDGKSPSGRACEMLKVRSTVRGPVISDLLPGYDRKDEVLSIQWAGFQPDITFNGYANLALAKNWDEFRAALTKLDINGNHFIFADSEGRIGYQLSGMLPPRAAAPPPLTPGEGWNHDDLWTRRQTADELPHRFDPPEGMMVSANNRPFNAGEGRYLGGEATPPQRRDRFYEILSSKPKFTARELMDTQHDTVNIVARLLLPFMLEDLAASGGKDHRWIKEELEKWDLKMETGSRAALLFEALFVFMARETFYDEMGEKLAAEYIDKSHVSLARFFLMMEDPGNRWHDDTRTQKTETRRDITLRAADASLAFLAEKAGADRAKWQWGALHTLTVPHYAAPAIKFMNIKCGPVPGSEHTANRFGYVPSNPFSVTTIPDLRMFVDFDDPDHVHAVIHTGQSGWWGHRNYSDQAMKLVNAELISIPLNVEEIKVGAGNKLTLAPGGAKK